MSECVSVLMCVYNTPIDYLKDAVESILTQSYSNIEFVIVDDCSDDEAVLEFLAEIERVSDRVCIVRNENNFGLTKSLNIGLEHCRGEFIARMDSDDISLPGRIASQVEYLKSHKDVALVGSNIICFGEGMEDMDTSKISNPCDNPEVYKVRSLIQHSGPPHPTFMFRGDFLRSNIIRYREDILKAQDYGIMADILKSGGKITRLREPLLKYREHSGQISAKSDLEQKIYQLRISYDYIKTIFGELSDAECLSIALLGCRYDLKTVKQAIETNDSLNHCYKELGKAFCELNRPEVYIRAQKKLFRINEKKKYFSPRCLRTELGYEWWKRALHSAKEFGGIWLLNWYTISSYRYNIQRKIDKIRL